MQMQMGMKEEEEKKRRGGGGGKMQARFRGCSFRPGDVDANYWRIRRGKRR